MTTPKQPTGRDLKAMLTGGKPPVKPGVEIQQEAEQARLTDWLGKPTEPMSPEEIFKELFGKPER